MHKILQTLQTWQRAGQKVAIARVVKVWGSAPRPLGSAMVISETGEFAGSVSGGCVESAVLSEAEDVIQSGTPKLASFGVADEKAWSLGLSCGGEIDVFIQPLPDSQTGETQGQLESREETRREAARVIDALEQSLAADRFVTLATLLTGRDAGRQMLTWAGGQSVGNLGTPRINQRASVFAERCFQTTESARKSFEYRGDEVEVFFHVFPPRPKLILVGAVHAALSILPHARSLGFETTVIDPRSAFATAERFAEADRLLREDPASALNDTTIDKNTYLVVLSHDPKVDLPALEAALRSRARYVGALGSRKTHRRRVERLAEAGFAPEALARIHSPVGLDIGARTADEIAISILAEIVAVRRGASIGNREDSPS